MADFELTEKPKVKPGRVYEIIHSGGVYTVKLATLDPWRQSRIGKLLRKYNKLQPKLEIEKNLDQETIAKVWDLLDRMWNLAIDDWDSHKKWFEKHIVDEDDWLKLFLDITKKMSEQVTGKPAKKKRHKKRKKQKQLV